MNNFIEFISKKEVYGLIIILLVVYLLNKVFNVLVDKFIKTRKDELSKKRTKTVVVLIKNIKKYALLIIGIVVILDLYGVNTSSMIASLGVASAVIALAFQDSLKDIISGASMIMDNYFIVGDVVKYGDFTGTVIEFGLRCTKIKAADGQVLTVANRNISQIINLSQKTSGPLIIIPTAYEEKVEKVEKVINEILEEVKTWPDVDKEKTTYVGIMELAESSVNYGIRIFCKQDKQWQYKWDALRLIKIKYDAEGIKIPYNQIEVHSAK